MSPRQGRKKTARKSTAPAGMERLQKVLALAGVGSRRGCDQLILEGVVTVNGRMIDTLPAFVNPKTDDIRVNNQRLRKARLMYFLLHKPKRTVCTNDDPQGRTKAIDLVDCPERIFCVGRLDTETSGAIILTNDMELTNRLTHPRYELPKTYEVSIRGQLEGDAIEQIKRGIRLADGKLEKAAVKVLHRGKTETILEIVVAQGLSAEIRSAIAHIGYKARAVKRTRIGNIDIKTLPIGGYRHLTVSEIRYLYKITKLEEAPAKGAKKPTS